MPNESAQEIFEEVTQEQADHFQLLTQKLKDKYKEAPLAETMRIIAQNNGDKIEAMAFLRDWITNNIVPLIEHANLLTQEQVLDYIAGTLVRFGFEG